MEMKLTVNIGATLQVKNDKGEWDWIKPEVGAEVSLNQHDLRHGGDDNSMLQNVFAQLWDDVVGPQFANVVKDLIAEPLPPAETSEETVDESATDKVESSTEQSEDEYY